jgi:hypothetical protein
VPETVSGHSTVPSHSDSERTSRDRLARIEEQLAALTAAVTDLAERFADAEVEAEEILRRAAAPAPAGHQAAAPAPAGHQAAAPAPAGHRAPRRGRRSDTILYVVRTALVALLGVGAVLALMAPRHLRDQQYTRRSTVQVAHHGAPRKASP